jgi:excinuclease ABC subunit B
MDFKVISSYKPQGDQGNAIAKLSAGLKKNFDFQTLWGVTGSGKTYVMAKIIEKTQCPTLIISPNKTLAAQLYEEFKTFFPENNVHYFVSYYDYYQPEAYMPATDTYVDKDVKINDEIDRMRHAAVQSLLTNKDTIIIASVSAIYNLGDPQKYRDVIKQFRVGQKISEKELFTELVKLQYERNDYELARGKFRKRTNFVDIWTSGTDEIIRIEILANKITDIQTTIAPFGEFKKVEKASMFPAKFWVSGDDPTIGIAKIEKELKETLAKLKKQEKLLEAERLKRRTEYDLAMIRETGFCSGIENYSSILEGRAPGVPPYTLLDYFPKNFLLFLDESHIGIPQLRGMYFGDKARKDTLIEYGFRLPSARDNRPLKFEEFEAVKKRTVFVSATPSDYEYQHAKQTVEQIIRPTHLLDPQIEIRKTDNQINDLMEEIRKRTKNNQRVLVLTLTKKMAEAVASHLQENKIKSEYIHSELKTFKRSEKLADLRKGTYDVLVGINLLREGLDLPEVSLIAILDADKEGFLRDSTSLIQIMGRAARHLDGKVIMYADKITKSMDDAIKITQNRRKIQDEYNKTNGFKPEPIIKGIASGFRVVDEDKAMPKQEFLHEYLKELKSQLDLARRNLQFDKASSIKAKIDALDKNNKPE